MPFAYPPAPPQIEVRTDEAFASEGVYSVLPMPWCAHVERSLKAGRDYANAIRWRRGTLPREVAISWRFPPVAKRPAKCGVFGYDFVAWGNYHDTASQAAVRARRVGDIAALRFDYALTARADPQSYNMLAEFYLTRAKGDFGTKAIEIGFLTHLPEVSRNFWRTQRQLGVFLDRYRQSWTVSFNSGGFAGGFAAFLPPPGVSRPSATLDAKGALDFLRARRLVDAHWWFNGAAMGIEPHGGSGSATLHRWNVTYR